MIKVGLTGSKFSGKKTVCKLLKSIGVPVFDADVMIRYILKNDEYTINKIKTQIGDHIFSDNNIDFSKITNTKEVDLILEYSKERLMHYYMIFNNKMSGHFYTIFKFSFLFEIGWNKDMDYNINVFCPKFFRVKRLAMQKNVKNRVALNMIKNEIDEMAKNKMSDFIINNNNEDKMSQIIVIINEINKNYISNSRKNKKSWEYVFK